MVSKTFQKEKMKIAGRYITLKTLLLLVLVLFIMFSLYKIGLSRAYLNDVETTQVTLKAGIWGADTPNPRLFGVIDQFQDISPPTPTPTPTPVESPTPTPEETILPSPISNP